MRRFYRLAAWVLSVLALVLVVGASWQNAAGGAGVLVGTAGGVGVARACSGGRTTIRSAISWPGSI